MSDNEDSIKNEDPVFQMLAKIAKQNENIKKQNDEITKQNVEINANIKEIKTDLSKQTEEINNIIKKVSVLENENLDLKKKLLVAEQKIRKNNLVIYGVEENENADIISVTIKIFSTKLNVEINPLDINNIYRVGIKSENKRRPVIVELVRYIKKQEIFAQVAKLKGTGISLAHDLTPEEREEKKILYSHYKAARAKNYLAKIRKNTLYVNGDPYTYEDLKNKELGDIIQDQEKSNNIIAVYETNSAPATPDINSVSYIFPYCLKQNENKQNQNTTESELHVEKIKPTIDTEKTGTKKTSVQEYSKDKEESKETPTTKKTTRSTKPLEKASPPPKRQKNK